MGWIEVDAAAARGRRCDECVRTHRSGERANRRMSTLAAAGGEVLMWDGAQWAPQTVSSGGGGSGGANSPDKTQSNTYWAGAKQTFVPNLSTSGVNITPGTLPTNAAAGDIALDSGDANKLKVYDGRQ